MKYLCINSSKKEKNGPGIYVKSYMLSIYNILGGNFYFPFQKKIIYEPIKGVYSTMYDPPISFKPQINFMIELTTKWIFIVISNRVLYKTNSAQFRYNFDNDVLITQV